jgi:hypothetical protein
MRISVSPSVSLGSTGALVQVPDVPSGCAAPPQPALPPLSMV